MKIINKYIIFLLCAISINAQELHVKAITFDGDELKGISTFTGDVEIKKGVDEVNASKVIIYTDQDRKPTKMEAIGDVSFYIMSDNNSTYKGKAGRVVLYPKKKEYHFYDNVELFQIDEKKEIKGDIVIVNTINGRAKAVGNAKKPVKMIFKMNDNSESK